jgi:hypothetical protein
MLALVVIGFVFIFFLYLLIEFALMGNANDFLDEKIVRRFLWLWLPFFALWRLTHEVFFDKKK